MRSTTSRNFLSDYADDDEVVDGEIVEYAACEHAIKGTDRICGARPVPGYPLCQRHMSRANIKDIRLVRGADISFEEIRGQLIDNPLEELAALVSEVSLYKDYCARKVAALQGQERYNSKTGEQLRAEVALYERSLDRLGRLLVDWSKLRIDERLAAIEEKKADTIISIIRGGLKDAEGLTDEGRKRVERYVVKELRAAAHKK